MIRLNKNTGADNNELEKLKEQVERLQRGAKSGVDRSGASSSQAAVNNDRLIARLLQEQERMKAKMESAVSACKRVEALESEIRVLKQQQGEAVQEAERWKREALKSGNKRSRFASSPSYSAQKPPVATPRRSPSRERPVADPTQLKQLHNLEVEALKELRLQELNRRREAEQELAKLKEELAQREAEKKTTPRSSFCERLYEAEGTGGGALLQTVRGKKKAGNVHEVEIVSDREAFIRDARKELRNLKKDDVMEICMKEGVKYTTLVETVTEIISKRVERAFGKKAFCEEISDDVAGEPLAEGKDDGRDSASS
ncbi:hypothetical protein CBR_g37081 [Chara braunii]|uniref:Uncharacterized protein n=1 Tax=Chara braunii TaxID=69332 RepID=A0A388LM35_CHABU|nr:hypothetical protein CBR_g37081 [Chara braunii]|eukprot:GBG83367.1 hypothetical protein CBR_g37081 [Chara braunii]